MHSSHQDLWGEFGFELEAMTTLGRAGSFRQGHLEAYITRQRRLHAKLHAEIDDAFTQAADDPEVLARLKRPLD